jgi:hypothetical protein
MSTIVAITSAGLEWWAIIVLVFKVTVECALFGGDSGIGLLWGAVGTRTAGLGGIDGLLSSLWAVGFFMSLAHRSWPYLSFARRASSVVGYFRGRPRAFLGASYIINGSSGIIGVKDLGAVCCLQWL